MRGREYIKEEEDDRLAYLCREGDLYAFEELVRRHEKKMLNIAYRTIGDYEEACDTVQDAFISAYKSINSFRGDSGFSTWLISIVVNLSRSRVKRLRVRHSRIPVSIDEIDADAERIPSNDPGADDFANNRLIREKLRICLDGLDIGLREIAVLKDIEGLSYESITGILKIPEGTVKSRLSRARALLKNCLKGSLGVI